MKYLYLVLGIMIGSLLSLNYLDSIRDDRFIRTDKALDTCVKSVTKIMHRR